MRSHRRTQYACWMGQKCEAISKRTLKQCKRNPLKGERLCCQHKNIEGRDFSRPHSNHETQCSVCVHPDREKIDAMWLDWSRGGASLCREYGFATSSFARHLKYFNMHEKRVSGFLEFCSIGIGKALRSSHVRLSDAAALGNLAMKFIHGGEVVKHEIIGQMEADLFPRVYEAMLTAGVTTDQVRAVAETLADNDDTSTTQH